jgi:hypothetical protein
MFQGKPTTNCDGWYSRTSLSIAAHGTVSVRSSVVSARAVRVSVSPLATPMRRVP